MALNYVSSDDLLKLLAENHIFYFKTRFTGWYIFYLFLVIIFGSIISVLLFPYGIILLVLALFILFGWIYYEMSLTLTLAPKFIKMQRKNTVLFECLYNNIFNVEFLVKTTVVDNVSDSENKFRIVTKNGRRKEITADYWKTPMPLPRNIYIYTILKYYLKKNGIN